MQTKFAPALVAAFAALTLATFAATPVAVWDGDFSPSELTKFSGYELVDWQLTHGGVSHEGGTATDYSSVTIDRANAGLMCRFGAAKGAFTVLVKYSGLAASTSAKRVVFATTANSDWTYDRCGIRLLTDGTLLGLWNNSTTANSDADYPSNTAGSGTLPASGTIAYVYDSGSSGTSVYSNTSGDDDISDTAVWSSTSLKAGNMTGIAVGGMWSSANVSGAEAAQGMTVEALAVFDSVLTVAEMNAYVWPSEVQTIPVAEGIAVSSINSQIDANTYKTVKVVAEDGATITVDEAFSTALPIAVSSTGSIALSAASQPDASYFTGVDFSGVQGAVLRSWLTTPGVVGFNFNSANGTDTSAALVAGAWQANTSDASGTADLFGDGLSVLAWGSSLYRRGSSTFLDGYIDDAWSGNGATITLSNVPYETYDVVIYASTDSGSVFTAKTVNGTAYTWNAVQSAAVQGAGTWGSVGASSAIYGVNSLRIKNLSGPLTIYGGSRTNQARGGIAAIQIMPTDAPDVVKTYTLTLDGTATSWSTGTWTLDGATVSAPTAGNVVINATASTTLTIDADVMLGDVTVNGGDNIVVNLALGEKTVAEGDTAATYYSFYAGKVAVASGVLQQGSSAVLGTTPVVSVADGATFDLNAFAMNAATAVYVEGAGAGNWPWALTSSGNAFAGTIQNMYLSGNATVGGANRIVLGANWAGSNCYLDGFTLTKTGAGELYVRNFNTPEDGTIVVQEGILTTAQWNCFNRNYNSSILLSVAANGTLRATNEEANPPAATTLAWDGALNTSSRKFVVKGSLNGGGSTDNLEFNDGATATLSRDITVATSLTLNGSASFNKAQGVEGDVTVTTAGTLTAPSTGVISVGAGVVFNLGTARPAASFTVDDEGTLVVKKSSATDVPIVHVSARPANVVFKDETGAEIASPRLVYDAEAGTLSFYTGNVWTAANDTVFDTVANWSSDATPASGENATVSISGDTAITVAGTYTLATLTITGAGEVTFAGAGSITAENVTLENGATLKRDTSLKITATTGISLASGTVLKLDGVTESASISGAGAVETYGNVVFSAANTFTGGLTVKSGTTSTTVARGFAGYASDYDVRIAVEDGACLDLANTKDYQHSLTIAGKGVMLADGTYSGAVKNSGVAMNSSTRQTWKLTLTADAMVDVSTGWGLVRSSHSQAALVLNTHTLTMRGTGTVPMVNVNASSTTGMLVLDGATLQLTSTACNFTGVDIVLKGAASVDFSTAPTAIGSLTLAPSASGTTAMAWNLPANFVPALNTSNVDPSKLSVGGKLTLFTAPSGTELADSSFSFATGSRYTVAASSNTVTATVNALAPFFHYDFNAANSIAADSTYNFGNLNPTFVSAKNGKAGKFSSYWPYYGSNTSGKSPFHAGEMTVMGLVKAKEANNTILWNFGSGLTGSTGGIALLAKDSKTFSLVSWTSGDGSEVASVSNIDVLNKWHLVTVVANGLGTTLYVDGVSASSSAVLPAGITAVGQFGSIHGTSKNYNAIGTAGFLLDDWRVYDAALTTKEIRSLKSALLPDPIVIRFR